MIGSNRSIDWSLCNENIVLDVYFYSSDVCDGAFLGTELTIACSKLTTETLEQGVKHVQSQQ